MTLKRKIAINISVAFSIIFGTSAILVYLSFSSFRKEEFKARLLEKALTTSKLLIEVKEIDSQLLTLIDRNSLNKIYNEKTLVFNNEFKLVYSSIEDESINYDLSEIKALKEKKEFYRSQDGKDILGIYYDSNKVDYYILVSAEDKYGYSKLSYLFYSLLVIFFAGTSLVWLTTYYFIKRLLKPLDNFQKKITYIDVNKLNYSIESKGESTEINLLTIAFNKMLARLEKSFIAQKEFTANASHELRTPISRLTLQLENLILKGNHPASTLKYLTSMQQNINQMSELTTSLLILSKVSSSTNDLQFKTERIDEIIFSAMKKVKNVHQDFIIHFDIDKDCLEESSLEINANSSLLEIAFANLFLNAYLYSFNRESFIHILSEKKSRIKVFISNNGSELTEEEQINLFKPFVRGNNSRNIDGSGLGLRICKRILDYHGAKISYQSKTKNEHQFILDFSEV
jgi:signal transduction histidine kinase